MRLIGSLVFDIKIENTLNLSVGQGGLRSLSLRHLHLPKAMMGLPGPFFVLVSKGFGGGDRPPETTKSRKTGL